MITESGTMTPEALARWQSDPGLRKQHGNLKTYHNALLEEYVQSPKPEGNSEVSNTATASTNNHALPGGKDSKFLRIVAEHMQRGKTKAEAMRAAAGEDPEAHRAWIEDINRAHA